MIRAALVTLLLLATPLRADPVTDALMAALQAPRLAAILTEEGRVSARDVNRDFLDGAGGAVYDETVARLNDPERLLRRLADGLTAQVSERDRAAVTLFFDSDLGQQIVDLELSAREAFLDDSVEQAVEARVAETGVPPLVAEFIEASNLVERNTDDGLEILRAFFLGLRAGGQTEMSESDIDTIVGASRDDIAADTRAWLEAYLSLAYSPLSEADMRTYLDFWQTGAGQAFDAGLFAAFRDAMIEDSFALGQLVGRLQMSEDI